MAARAENKTGVKAQRGPAVVGYVLPLGDDYQLFADLDGLVVFAPVVFPVAVLDEQGLDAAVCPAYPAKHGAPVLVVAEVALYAAHSREAALQLVVNVVPVLMIIFKEILKISLVLDDEAFRAHRGHLLAAALDLVGGSVDAHLDISHSLTSVFFLYFNPREMPCQSQERGAERSAQRRK